MSKPPPGSSAPPPPPPRPRYWFIVFEQRDVRGRSTPDHWRTAWELSEKHPAVWQHDHDTAEPTIAYYTRLRGPVMSVDERRITFAMPIAPEDLDDVAKRLGLKTAP